MTYLAIDPGVTNGYAIFNEHGDVMVVGLKNIEELPNWLESLSEDIKVCIYEGYHVFPNVSHTYSEVPTAQAIGVITSWATRHKVKLVKQFSHQKKDGYKLLGMKPPKSKKEEHYHDAVAHGVLYLTKIRVRKVGPPPNA